MVPGFKISDGKKAIHVHARARRARHEARNAKRISLGRQPTAFKCFGAEYLPIIEESLDDFEDSGDEIIVPTSSMSVNQTSADKPPESTWANVSPGEETCAATCQQKKTVTTLQDSGATSFNLPTPRLRNYFEEESSAAHSLPKRSKSTCREFTGPALITTAPLQHKPNARAALATAGARSNLPVPGSRGPSASVNVFIGSTVRKNRRNLLDAVSDTNMKPKMLRLRHQNIVRKRLRDREGLVDPAFPTDRLAVTGSSASDIVHSNSASGSGLDTNGDDFGEHLSSKSTTVPPKSPNPAVSRLAQPSSEPLGSSKRQTGESREKRKRSVRWDDNITVMETERS